MTIVSHPWRPTPVPSFTTAVITGKVKAGRQIQQELTRDSPNFINHPQNHHFCGLYKPSPNGRFVTGFTTFVITTSYGGGWEMQQTEREAAHGRDRDNGERGKSQTPILQLSCLTCKLLFRTFQIYIYIYTHSYMCYIQLHYINTIYVYIYDIRMTYDFIYWLVNLSIILSYLYYVSTYVVRLYKFTYTSHTWDIWTHDHLVTNSKMEFANVYRLVRCWCDFNKHWQIMSPYSG